MGEQRRRQIKHERIRNGEFSCVYCGGIVPACEPDHMPPRILFKGKIRPNDLVFPSCAECNRGSAAIDTLIGWLGRIYPDPATTAETMEMAELGKSMITNFPEVASAFHLAPPDRVPPLTAEAKARLGSFSSLHVDDPYVHRCIEMFGAKFGLGMHWRTTGDYVKPDGRVYSRWFSNAQAIAGAIPNELFTLFPKPQPLQQGKLHTAGRFEHDSAVAGSYSSHLAIFGRSFLVLSLVSQRNHPDFTKHSTEFAPGCLKQGYPYGLPSLSAGELKARFDRLKAGR